MAADEADENESWEGAPTAEEPEEEPAERRRREVLDVLVKLLRGPQLGGP